MQPSVPVVVDTSRSAFSALRPVSLTQVHLNDTFWTPRREINHKLTLPSQYQQCEVSGRLDNFRRAAGLQAGEFHGRFFNDSDIYKWLEAAAWVLATETDAVLESQVNAVIELVAAAQEDDGYLNTYFMFERTAERWTDLVVKHELYCAGHLIQAAVAHHRATGSRALLDVAIRFADLITATFGPDARHGACGHPEIEMALVELARDTGDERYLRQAQFFIDQHGQQPPVIGGDAYHLDHQPFREQRDVVGHAVRALYLYAGATDVYAETGEPALDETLEALWDDLQACKLYITGGAGARYEGEAFGAAYELPNERAYAETCAAIANVMWNWRLLLVKGEARFADALELALYNGVLSGISLDGQTYFYQNPLADRGSHRRVPWFTTACCPPNIARLLASLPAYFYATSDEGLWVNLYATSAVTTTLASGQTVTLRQQTEYPWSGEIMLDVRLSQPTAFSLFLRIPAWASGATVLVNDAPLDTPVVAGSYLAVQRIWQAGDVVRLTLPMPMRLLESHPYVTNNRHRVALMRGPLVYCLEQVDHPNVDVWDIILPRQLRWDIVPQANMLGGIVVAHTEALAPVNDTWTDQLYRTYDESKPAYKPVRITAIPYYAWANRAAGPMQVWLPLCSKDDCGEA